MATNISHSPEETAALGEKIGRAAQPGWVLGLSGELGAGKTQFVKGLARGLDIRARIQSPTFALIQIYREGRLPLFHLDLYRLTGPEQFEQAGLQEYLHTPGVTVMEWPERVFAPSHGQNAEGEVQAREAAAAGCLLPAPAGMRWVQIDTASELERRISYELAGA